MNDKKEHVSSAPDEDGKRLLPEETISTDGTDDNDSDTDIQELFRKYLDQQKPSAPPSDKPEDREDGEREKPSRHARGGGLLSRLRNMAMDDEDDDGEDAVRKAGRNADRDDGDCSAETDDMPEEEPLDIVDGSEKADPEPEKPGTQEPEDGYPDEYAEEAAEEDAEEIQDDAPDGGDGTIDDTDINLMVAFGMDAELEKKVGSEAADKIRGKMSAPAKKPVRETVEFEYTDRSQIPGIAKAYKSSYRATIIKMVVALAFSAYLLFYENISLLGIQFSGALDPKVYPLVYVMVGLQVCILACACAYEQIFKGFRRLFTGHPSAESIPAVMLTVNVIYSVVVVATAGSAAGDLQLFNAPVALCAVFALLHDLLGIRREMYSFNVVSSKKTKYVMRRIPAQDAPLETETFHTDSDVLKIEKATFVDGFFSRVCTSDRQNSATIGFLSVVIPLAAALMALIAAYAGGGVHPARAAGMTFSAAYPLALLLNYSLPFFHASRRAYDNDSAIVGECSLEEYADASLVSVDESIVYPSYGVKVQNIRVFNNYRIDKVLYFAASVFRKTGGPLSEVFSVATGDVGFSDDVELLRCEPGILSAKVDGRTVTFGKGRQLMEGGFPDVMPEEDAPEDPELSVMYMFRDEILVAEMYVKYMMDSDFEFLLGDLASSGMSVCIRSFDPNIDEELLMKNVDLEQSPLRVVKMTDLRAAEVMLDRIDSGLVTRGVPKNLLQTQPYCDSVLNVRRNGERLSWIAVLLTLVIAGTLVLSGHAGWGNSLFVSLYQLLWMLPVGLLTGQAMKY